MVSYISKQNRIVFCMLANHILCKTPWSPSGFSFDLVSECVSWKLVLWKKFFSCWCFIPVSYLTLTGQLAPISNYLPNFKKYPFNFGLFTFNEAPSVIRFRTIRENNSCQKVNGRYFLASKRFKESHSFLLKVMQCLVSLIPNIFIRYN